MANAERNETWTRDELIVALEFYLRHPHAIPSKSSPEIADLSAVLNELKRKVGGEFSSTFRNTNGVYMKLMNFRRFDPGYTGKGLQRGGKDEEVVWRLYANNRDELSRVANAIRSFAISDVLTPPISETTEPDLVEAEEGRLLSRLHLFRERDARIVNKKKAEVVAQHGKLICSVCSFDFSQVYGERGDGFIECHHSKPISSLVAGQKTKLSDLELVCSNCHRMIHRKKPWLTISELRSLLHKLEPSVIE